MAKGCSVTRFFDELYRLGESTGSPETVMNVVLGVLVNSLVSSDRQAVLIDVRIALSAMMTSVEKALTVDEKIETSLVGLVPKIYDTERVIRVVDGEKGVS